LGIDKNLNEKWKNILNSGRPVICCLELEGHFCTSVLGCIGEEK